MDFDPTTADPSKGVAAESAAGGFDPGSADPAKAITGDDYVRTLAKDDAFDPSDYVNHDRDLALKVFKARAVDPITVGDVIHGTGAFLKGFGKGLYEMPLTLAKGVYGAGRVLGTVAKSAVEGKSSFGAPDTPEQAEADPKEVQAARAEAAGALLSLGNDIYGQWTGLKHNGSRLLSLVTGGHAGHLDKQLSDDDIAGILQEQSQIKALQSKIATGDIKGALSDTGYEQEAAATPSAEELSKAGYSGEEAAAIGSTFNPELAIPFDKALTPGLVAKVAGPGLRAAGNVVKGAGAILDNPLTRRTAHYAPMYAMVHAAATGDLSHVLKYLAVSGVPMAGRGLKEAGEFAAQAGREMALSPAEQSMYSAFREASETQPGLANRVATRGLQRAASGAVAMAPFAASAQSPEEAGSTLGGGAALGLVGGIAHDAVSTTGLAARKALFDTALKTKANGGQTVINLSSAPFDYGHDPALDQLHNSTVASLPPEDAATINQWRHLEQGRTEIYVIPEAAFDARYPGVSAWGKADVINGRRVILYRGASGVENALSHEPLHPVYQNLSPEAKAEVDRASLSRTDPSEFASNYYSRLRQTPTVIDFNTLPDTAPGGQVSKSAVLEEMAADTMRNLTINQITQQPTIRRQIQISLGKAMESLGLPTTTEEVRGILGVQPTFKAIATLEAALRGTAKQSEAAGPTYGKKPTPQPATPPQSQPPASTTVAPQPPIQPGAVQQPKIVAPPAGQPTPVSATPQPKTVSPDAIRDAVAAMTALKFKRMDAQRRVAQAASDAAHLGIDVNANDLLAHALSGKFPQRTQPAAKPSAPAETAPAKTPGAKPESAAITQQVAEPSPEPRLAGFLWDKVLRGDISIGDMPSQLLMDAREGIRTGEIKNAQDFEAFLESKRSPKETETSEPPAAPVPKIATPPTEGGGVANAVSTALPEDTATAINRAGEDAAQSAVGATRKGKEIERARVSAMAEKHAESADPDLVTHRLDPFGKPSITGRRLDPADPLHARLISNAGLQPQAVGITNRLAKDAGKNVALIDYGSAPVAEDVSGVSRKAEQAAAPAQERAAGTKPMQHADKNFIPSTIVYNHGSGQNKPSILVRGFSPDKFLHNARQLFPWLEANGFLKGEDGKPFYSGPDDPKLAEDFRAMAANHANGYRGDGEAPVKGTPFTRVKVNPDFEPTKIPLDRFRVVNALVGAPYPDTGATPRQADIRALSKLNAPEAGGNLIWQKLGEEKALLESTIENIRPDLVGDVREEADPTKAIRQSGRLEGTPRQDFAAAGFMPRDPQKGDLVTDDAHVTLPRMQFLPAHHGTPHEVDRFSLEHVGKGEGVQAYGWGLYFAENPTVAGDYQKTLSKETFRTNDGKIWSPDELEHLNIRSIARKNGEDLAATIKAAERIAKSDSPVRELAARDAAKLNQLRDSGGITKHEGNIYTVDIDVRSDELLDWDKPLGQQSETVQKAFREKIFSPEELRRQEEWQSPEWAIDRPEDRDKKWWNSVPASTVYHKLASEFGEREASELLNSAGVKGIRYLDQGSRMQQAAWGERTDKTHNFVMFDDSRIKITHKNGEEVSFEEAAKESGYIPREEKSPLPDDAHAEAEKLGLKYKGVTMGKLPTYDDPQTGSTITFGQAKTAEGVRAKIDASREAFRANRGEIKAAKKAGHDGLKIVNTYDPVGDRLEQFSTTQWVAFNPTQIKSATGNTGAFDPKKADIRFMPRGTETDSELASRIATEKAERYFEIGQADDEAMKTNLNWIYDPSSRAVKAKQGGTHGSNFTHEVADRSFKGWFDRESDTISVVFPAHELRKLDGEPTVDDIPSSVFNALRSKFGKTAKMVAFMPRGEETKPEAIAEPPGLTRLPFKGAAAHKRFAPLASVPNVNGVDFPVGTKATGYNTPLSDDEEKRFQEWKSQYASKDSGDDYDYRGAWKAGLKPDARGHWPDLFKKPNHPTFSDESVYADETAGHWNRETFR
jgi:hypothetical protein